MTITVQMRAKGGLTVPTELRKKYALEDGEVFTLFDLGEGSLLFVPRVSLVPKLVAELEAIREEAGLTVDDLLAGLSDERRRLFEERQSAER
jgi:bifunctional DNA-binding transcriptional regulator/antitoxin component of YhaV-PrlF toxin-antitoxin module